MRKNKKTWGLTLYLAYALTILLVLVTVFAVLLRVGISELEENPEWIKSWLSLQLNAEVEFKNLEIASLGNTILVGLQDLNVQAKQNKVSLLRAAEIEVKINWLQSALNFGLKTSEIKLKSPFVSLVHHEDGHFSIGNIESSKPGEKNSIFNRWLFEQQRVKMTNLELHLYSMRFNKLWHIQQADLVVIPAGKQRKMQIHSAFANQGWLKVKMQWSGDLGQVGGWYGRAHINGENLPADLIMPFAPNEFITLHQSLVSVNSQFKWEKGKIHSGFGQLDMRQTLFINPQTKRVLFIEHSSADFQAWTAGKLTKASLNLKLPESKDAPAQEINLFALLSKDKAELVIPSLNHKIHEYFAPIIYSEKGQTIFDKLKPQGEIERLQLSIPYAEDQPLKAKLGFSNLAFDAIDEIPGISATNGSINVEGNNIKLTFDSDDLAISFPNNFFRQPLKIGKVAGSLAFSLLDNKQWVLSSEKIIVKTDDANASLAFRMKSTAAGRKPFVELVANFNAISPQRAPEYLPVKIMKPNLIKWLDNAFSTGTVTNGLVLLHGNLNKYPFVNKTDGAQLISMDVKNAELFYKPNWPKVKNISAKLIFNERGMVSTAHSASTSGIEVKSLRADIANFKDPELALAIDSQPGLSDLQEFIKQTPLEKTFGKILSKVSIDGDSLLKLAIDIPLKKSEGELKTIPKIKGSLSLAKNQLKVLPLNLTLSALSGEIDFTENSISSPEIKGSLLGGQFNSKITTATAFDKSDGLIKITGDGDFIGNRITSWAKFLTPDIKGSANWHAQLQFAKNGKHQAKINSNMKGVTVYMPNIINKPKPDALASQINVNWGKDGKIALDFSGTDIVKGKLQKNQASTWRGGISLFNSKIKTYKSGILISGNPSFINSNSWDKWLANKALTNKTTKPSKQKIFVAGSIDKLLLGQTNFKKVNINGNYYQGKWMADFKTPAFAGKVTVPPKPAPINISIERYVLGTNFATDKTATSQIPKTRISLKIKSLIMDGKNLGRFKVNLIPTADGARISNLNLGSSAFNLSGSGRWQKKANKSTINVKLSAKKLQALLRVFGYTGRIKDAKTNASLAASWRGSPLNFSLKKISGNGKLKISGGDFIDVDTKSSAKSLVSLLKFNLSRVNKNSLDFRNITGNFLIKNGILNTQGIKLNSVAADIKFRGNAGLIRKTYDMHATITPKLGGTLPLIGAATAGVPGLVVGGVAAAIDKASNNGISKAARKKLKITGSWANPIVRDLGKSKQKADNTADTDLLGFPTYD